MIQRLRPLGRADHRPSSFGSKASSRNGDGDLPDVRRAAARARSAYGPKDSVRDALPPEATEPFLEAIDRLIREIARHDRSR